MPQPTATALLGLLALLVFAGCNVSPAAQSQGQPKGCPPGQQCVVVTPWPPMTVIYEVDGPIYTDGAREIRPRETRHLEYQDRQHWRVETIASEPFRWGSVTADRTGSWEQQDGTVYKTYDAVTGNTSTDTTQENAAVLVDGIFSEVALAEHQIGTRTDGTPVETDTDICEGDDCHAVQGGAQGTTGQTAPSTGQTFTERGLGGLVVTADELGIPIASGTMNVLRLEIRPTMPDADACQTNLREVIVEASLDGQMWQARCASTNRENARAHYYEFHITEPQDVQISTSGGGPPTPNSTC